MSVAEAGGRPRIRGLAVASRRLARVREEVWTPRKLTPIDQWCDEHRRLPATGAGAARSGRWSTDSVPYFREPMRMMLRATVAELSVLKSAQVGYSEFVNSCLLHLIGERRRPGMIVYPTYNEACDYNEKRLIPSLNHCGPVRAMIRSPRDVTKTDITLDGIPLWFAFAHTPKTLKSDPVADIFADEIDEWPPDGVAMQNARDRQKTFHERKLVKGSTPDHGDGITREYAEAAHRYRYMVPCPITGKFFELWDLSLLRWEGGLTADPEAVLRNTWVQSPAIPVPRRLKGAPAEGRIRESMKPWMVLHGVWVRQGEEVASDGSILETIETDPRDLGADYLSRIDPDELRDPPKFGRHRRTIDRVEPDPRAAEAREKLGVRIVGGDAGAAGRIPHAATVAFRVNTLASLIDAKGWGGVAERFVATHGKPGGEWYKGTLGQLPSGDGDSLSVRQLRTLCKPAASGGYRMGEVPGPCGLVYGGVDVQKDCVYLTCRAFGPVGEPNALVWAERIEREESRKLEDIAAVLASLRFRPSGEDVAGDPLREPPGLRPVEFAIDSGHWAEDVYRFCRLMRSKGIKCWPVKGVAVGARYTAKWGTVDETKDELGRRKPRAVPESVLFVNGDRLKAQLMASMMPHGDPEASDASAAAAATDMLFRPKPGEIGVLLPDDRDGWDDLDERRSRDALDYMTQVTNEERVRVRVQGRTVLKFKLKKEHAANHYLDADVYASAIARSRGIEQLTDEQCRDLRRYGAGFGAPGDGGSVSVGAAAAATVERATARRADEPRRSGVASRVSGERIRSRFRR